MSERLTDSVQNDPLLAALRELPPHAQDATSDARLQRQARAAYERSFDGASWSPASRLLGRAAVPLFLACIVGLYMTWAFAAAARLVQ